MSVATPAHGIGAHVPRTGRTAAGPARHAGSRRQAIRRARRPPSASASPPPGASETYRGTGCANAPSTTSRRALPIAIGCERSPQANGAEQDAETRTQFHTEQYVFARIHRADPRFEDGTPEPDRARTRRGIHHQTGAECAARRETGQHPPRVPALAPASARRVRRPRATPPRPEPTARDAPLDGAFRRRLPPPLPENARSAEIVGEPDRRDLTGPFDIIGDVYGCREELVAVCRSSATASSATTPPAAPATTSSRRRAAPQASSATWSTPTPTAPVCWRW